MNDTSITPFLLIILIGVLVLLSVGFLYKWALKTRYFTALLLSLLVAVFWAGSSFLLHRIADPGSRISKLMEEENLLLYLMFLVCLTPFLLTLHKTWRQPVDASQPENTEKTGFAAYFTLRSVLLVIGMSFSGAAFMGCNAVMIALMAFAVLAIYPLMHPVEKDSAARSASPESSGMGEEKQRIMKMVEAGTINASEGAELLAACGSSSPTSAPQNLSKTERLKILGAAVVALSFLMPWFTVHTRKVMDAQMQLFNEMQPFSSLSAMSPGLGGVQRFHQNLPDMIFKISGADVGRGLGWIILVLALAVPVMKWILDQTQVSRRHQLEKICSFGGGALLLYVLFEGFQSVSIGLILAMAGYGILVYGVTRDQEVS